MDPETDTGRHFLEVRGVSKSFGGHRGHQGARVQALDQISFSMPAGRFVSVVGPSGCGKSTLLRIVDGLELPDVGEVLIEGTPVREPSLDRGVVFQSPNLLPWRTVQRNVEFGLESLGVRRGERAERARELIDLVGLADFAESYPSQLSGGMQQRVGLARALALNPAMLLMDEPFAAVDAQTRLVLQEELERIWLRSEKSVVFITHDIEEALFLADVVLVMSKSPGRIIDTVPVPFPRPRTYDIRGTAEFAALVRRLLDALRVQVRPGRAGEHDDETVDEPTGSRSAATER